jgi:16S rRNA (uracil1498-N3)-methyltransferase
MSTHPQTRRFFVSDLSSDEVRPNTGERHHALHVLRLKNGDEVELFDGAGGVAVGVIEQVDRRNVVMRVTDRQARQLPPSPAIQVAFASPKGKRLDWLVEKATELGAASLQRVVFDRSAPAAKYDSSAKTDKLMVHCVSAAKQCGLNFLPKLPDAVTLAEILVRNDNSLKLLGDTEHDAMGLSEAIGNKTPFDSITLLIGPEGGLTQSERSESIKSGFIPVKVAQTTLRTETAAIALLSATVASTLEI